jgi:hypothetical protein
MNTSTAAGHCLSKHNVPWSFFISSNMVAPLILSSSLYMEKTWVHFFHAEIDGRKGAEGVVLRTWRAAHRLLECWWRGGQ